MEILETIGAFVEGVVHIGVCIFFGVMAVVFIVQAVRDDIDFLKNEDNKE